MSPAPFLSIVTISYNQAAYLREAIASVVSQKADDVEYIVVDPGSTDGSREIIAGFGAQIDHVVLDPDDGPADGLNKGFARARGRIGYFLNADDFLLPHAIDALRRLWRENGDLDFLLCRAWMIDGQGRAIRELIPTPIRTAHLKFGAATIAQQGVSFTLDLFRAVGGFNPANRSCWDYELFCQFTRRGARFRTAPDRIAAFRLYDGSITGGGMGDAHQARFDADFRRVHEAILGQADTPPRIKLLRAGRWYKMIANPAHALHRMREHLLPWITQARWRADLEGTAPRA